MKINIASSHRFHLLDLARELSHQGYDVKFYSYVPTKRSTKYGLNKKNSFSLFYLISPIIILEKIIGNKKSILKIKYNVLDILVSKFMRKCDVFIGIGTVYKKTFIQAKKNNSTTIMEWGSKHIYEEEKYTLENSNAKPQIQYFIDRSISGYKLADYIAIPSEHVKESFIKQGIDKTKLLKNPYGVDLKMFPSTILNNQSFDIIFVGSWSFRKGCDYIYELIKNTSYTFLHVGSINDFEFPNHERMTHIDPVDQTKLYNFYSLAKVFLLPSRSEGLALVQAQAIACGLPIVCSKNTGGSDLRDLISAKDWIIEFEDYSLDKINEAISLAINLANTQSGIRNYVKSDLNNLSWEAYGKRYNQNLFKIINVTKF